MARLSFFLCVLVATAIYKSAGQERRLAQTSSGLGGFLPGSTAGDGTTVKSGRFSSNLLGSMAAPCHDPALQSAIFSCRNINTSRPKTIRDVCVGICEVPNQNDTCAPCTSAQRACVQAAGNVGDWQPQFVRTVGVQCLTTGG
eukprot:jgi/Botrbrau1/13445/Bobra.0082s0049.1